MQTITVNNPTRRRLWGWAWSCQPTGKDAYSIEIPTRPDYVGTLGMIGKKVSQDRTYWSLKSGGTFTATAWFWNGKRILTIDSLPVKDFFAFGEFDLYHATLEMED